MKTALVFKVLSRLIPLALFWDLVSVLIEHGFEFPRILLAEFSDIYTALPVALFYASVFTAVATVATGSPILYVVTLVLISVSRYHSTPTIPLASIVGLLAMLALDTIGFTYREGQGRTIRYSSLPLFVGSIVLSTFLVLIYILPSIFAGYFLLQLTLALHSSPSQLARVLAESVVFKLLLVTGVSILTYILLSRFTEVIATLAYPSRKIALKVLVDTSDLNVIYKAPLEFVKISIVVSFIAPPLYIVLLDYVLPLILYFLRAASPLHLVYIVESWWFRPLFSIVVLALSWRLVSRLVAFYEELRLKGVFVTSLLITALMYTVAVYHSYLVTGSLIRAVISPDFAFLEAGVRRVYFDYYVNFIYLFEAASALVGFAP